MKSTQDKIQELKNNGYELDFSTTFSIAFDIYKKSALISGLVIMLFSIILVGLVIIGFGSFIGFGSLGPTMTEFDPTNLSPIFIIGYIAILAIFGGLSAILGAGLVRIARDAYYDQDLNFGTAFMYFSGSHAGHLFIAGLLIAIVNGSASIFSELAGISFVGSILSIIISVATVLTIPLIIFKDLNATDAISASIALVFKNFFIVFGLILVGVICSLVGLIAFCIGLFFTLPFIYAIYYSIFVNIFGVDEEETVNQIEY